MLNLLIITLNCVMNNVLFDYIYPQYFYPSAASGVLAELVVLHMLCVVVPCSKKFCKLL